MALRGTLTHRKTRQLASFLKISNSYALGLLEALWHLTAEQAFQGNIGKMSNKDIAAELYWDGDPDALVSALTESALVDADAKYRLLVHDWHQHADYNVKRKLARFKLPFLTRFGEIAPFTTPDDASETSHDDSPADKSGKERVMTRHEAPSRSPKPETGNQKPEARKEIGTDGTHAGQTASEGKPLGPVLVTSQKAVALDAEQPPLTEESWTLTVAAVRKRFPLADWKIIQQAIEKTSAKCGLVTDGEMAEAVHATAPQAQKSAAFFQHSVSRWILTRRADQALSEKALPEPPRVLSKPPQTVTYPYTKPTKEQLEAMRQLQESHKQEAC